VGDLTKKVLYTVYSRRLVILQLLQLALRIQFNLEVG